ncbi:MAG: hypothetical protein ABSD29_26260 [Verrucomicrobiota bacterium]
MASQNVKDGRYEIQLSSVEWVAGGPCNFPQWPRRDYSDYWIYTDSMNGVVSADRVTIAYHGWDNFRLTREGPLQGSVSFFDGRVRVALKTPAFPDGVHLKYYMKFPLNGIYTLQPQHDVSPEYRTLPAQPQ